MSTSLFLLYRPERLVDLVVYRLLFLPDTAGCGDRDPVLFALS